MNEPSLLPPSGARLLRRTIRLTYAFLITGPLALLAELVEVFSNWRGVTTLFSTLTWITESRASRRETQRANEEASR